MFKNVQLYRLTRPVGRVGLEADLAAYAHAEIGNTEAMRQGWTKPRGDTYVHSVHGYQLIELTTDRRLLPSSVVNQVAKARAAELEEQQGFAPGKKAMKELKERVYDELLPRAFVKRDVTRVLITSEWLIVDAASPAKADDVIKMLFKAADRFPVESLRVQRSPVGVMTGWLEHDEAPAQFTIDMDATMRASGESKAQVTYKRHTLEPDAMRQHIAAGKQCVKLAMTWDSKISFVLTESLDIKSIKPLDIMKENNPGAANDGERFDNDLVLFAGEFVKLLNDLVDALGGFAQEQIAA
jgi:recombination associated protein RdgC